MKDKVLSINNKVLQLFEAFVKVKKKKHLQLVEPFPSQGVVTLSFFSTTKGTKNLKFFYQHQYTLADQTLNLDPSLMKAMM